MSCCAAGTNGCLDLSRRATALVGRVSAEWSRCPRSMARRPRYSVAPLRRSSAGWMPARTPADMLAVEIAIIQTVPWERRDGCRCDRGCGGLYTLMILYPAKSTHNHSVSDCTGDWSTKVRSNCSWINVARPYFLFRTDPTGVKLGITSLSALVQWVSWKR